MDATIIEAPSFTKNQSGQRDPEMHQTKKGNKWHFGMKIHISVDDTLGLIHSLSTTAANDTISSSVRSFCTDRSNGGLVMQGTLVSLSAKNINTEQSIGISTAALVSVISYPPRAWKGRWNKQCLAFARKSNTALRRSKVSSTIAKCVNCTKTPTGCIFWPGSPTCCE